MLRVRIEGENKVQDLKTITNLMKVNTTDKNIVIDYFTGRMMLKNNDYLPSNVTALIIVFKFYTEPNSNVRIPSYYGETETVIDTSSNKEVGKERIWGFTYISIEFIYCFSIILSG